MKCGSFSNFVLKRAWDTRILNGSKATRVASADIPVFSSLDLREDQHHS